MIARNGNSLEDAPKEVTDKIIALDDALTQLQKRMQIAIRNVKHIRKSINSLRDFNE